MTDPARPLICLGGTLCDARVFAPLLAHLSRPATIWSHNRYDRVSDAAAALVKDAPAEFIAIGFSLGGFVALDALRLAPEKVAGVILLSGNGFPANLANADARRGDVAAGRRDGLRAFIRARGADFVSPSCPSFDDIVGLIADMAEAEGNDVHMRQTEMNIHRPDLRSVTAASDRPILAIAGAEDRACPEERYLDLAKARNTTLKTIGGAGHFLPLEAPAACADAVETFLKEHEL